MGAVEEGRTEQRMLVVEAAAHLLRDRGPEAVTTRGVAEAAGVQAPTIYRLFGDKDGLLDAVAEHVMAGYVGEKSLVVEAAASDGVDPVDDLRAGWDAQIAFGLANPALFRLLSDPTRVRQSPAALAGRRVLEARVRRVAAAGRLRVGEGRAVDLIQAAGVGAIHALLSSRADPALASAMYEAVVREILVDAPAIAANAPVAAAVAFRTVVADLPALSASERALMTEWIDRAIAAS